MTIWLIEPHDPLIVRDGRPFNITPGARAISLPFPVPSTTTGGVRTRAGLNEDGVFDRSGADIELLKKLKVRGPLLVQLTQDGNEIADGKWLVSAPLDALLFPTEQEAKDKDKKATLKQLVPLQLQGEAQTDFDQKDHEKLMLVGLAQSDPQKPIKEPPRYWYWKKFQEWLLSPPGNQGTDVIVSELGHAGPQRERRMHVSIDDNQRVAKDGALFETSGLEFTFAGKQQKRLHEAERLALAVEVDEDSHFSSSIQEGLASFGGERRIVSWRKSSSQLPSCPKELVDAIIQSENKACRLILLTPAYFAAGYHPKQWFNAKDGVTPKLEAIAIQRPQIVSGWNLETRLRGPKPTRRLAPAGTVLFLSLQGNDQDINNWVQSMWMKCIGNDLQACNDGFGLAVLGTWTGKAEVMREGQES